MFKTASPLTRSATFGQRKPVMEAAAPAPAHVRAEWTGEQPRPQGAAERLRAILA